MLSLSSELWLKQTIYLVVATIQYTYEYTLLSTARHFGEACMAVWNEIPSENWHPKNDSGYSRYIVEKDSLFIC